VRHLEPRALASLLAGIGVGKVALIGLAGGMWSSGLVAGGLPFVAGVVLYARSFRDAATSERIDCPTCVDVGSGG
jgi:hypothetical protein